MAYYRASSVHCGLWKLRNEDLRLPVTLTIAGPSDALLFAQCERRLGNKQAHQPNANVWIGISEVLIRCNILVDKVCRSILNRRYRPTARSRLCRSWNYASYTASTPDSDSSSMIMSCICMRQRTKYLTAVRAWRQSDPHSRIVTWNLATHETCKMGDRFAFILRNWQWSIRGYAERTPKNLVEWFRCSRCLLMYSGALDMISAEPLCQVLQMRSQGSRASHHVASLTSRTCQTRAIDLAEVLCS